MSSETDYPEHEKLKKVKHTSQAIGEFLEWLSTQGLTVCETYRNPDSLRDGEYFPATSSTNALLARFFEIDLEKIEKEKQAMLEEMRKANGL